MIEWWHDQPLGAEAKAALASIDAAFALQGEQVAHAPLSRVIKVRLDGRDYYVKRYLLKRRRAERFGFGSLLAMARVRREWQNLLRFSQWGIATARVVAYGAERRFGMIVRGVLVTEGIPNTRDLAWMAKHADPRLRNPQWVDALSAQLAGFVQRMHAEGFAHNDLKWRNLLVDDKDLPGVFFIDCPTGGFWWQPFLQYRIIKDLACLDKVAKYQLSQTQRLRFYLRYVGREALTDADKRRIHKVLIFFEGRE